MTVLQIPGRAIRNDEKDSDRRKKIYISKFTLLVIIIERDPFHLFRTRGPLKQL